MEFESYFREQSLAEKLGFLRAAYTSIGRLPQWEHRRSIKEELEERVQSAIEQLHPQRFLFKR